MDVAVPLRLVMGGVFATLAAASAMTATLAHLRPTIDLDEIRVRVRSWWVMAAVFLAALVLDRRITVAFLTLLALAATVELRRMTGSVVLPVAVPAVVTASLVAAAGGIGAAPTLVVVAGGAVLVTDVLRGRTDGVVARAGGTMLAVAIGCGMAAMAAIVVAASGFPAGGPGLLLWLVVVAQVGDVAQFVTGRTIGRRRLAPVVSPNKTVEGLAGGLVVAGLLGGGMGLLLTPWSSGFGALLGLAVALCGSLGDLIVSAIKRDCGCDDAGNLIPGHGGVLDRTDSLVLSAPLLLVVVG